MPAETSVLDRLDRSLAPGLERLGRAVAVRAVLQWTSDPRWLAALAGAMVEAAGRWFRSRLTTVYAQGAEGAGYVTVLAEYAGGESALVTAEVCRLEAPATFVLVLGKNGTLRFDDAPAPLASPPAPSAARALIERSLASGEVRRAG